MGKIGLKKKKCRESLTRARLVFRGVNEHTGLQTPNALSPEKELTPGRDLHEMSFSQVFIGANRQTHLNMTPVSKSRLQSLKPMCEKPAGRRLITLSALTTALNWAADHGKSCDKGDFEIVKERKSGLETTVCVQCKTCNAKPVWMHADVGEKSLPANEAFAWATNVSGIGYTGLKHAFTALDVPSPSFNAFKRYEAKFSSELAVAFMKQLEENGKEEHVLAKERNQIIVTPSGPIPWTSVYCDGQWSKRCYNQQGTAMSGSAAMIGSLTKKPLFVGIRNKFCYICHRYGENAKVHVCFKNFTGSSSAMEASIIKEGFNRSVEMHTLIYKNLIGDGDSSVTLTVQDTYNKAEFSHTQVKKIECKNHAIRRLNYNLHKIIENKMLSRQDRGALKLRVPALARCCKYAIDIHAERKSNFADLMRDLLNLLNHVFGDHSWCPSYLCTNGVQIVPDRYKKADFQPPAVESQSQIERKNLVPQLINTSVWTAAMGVLERLASLSNSLIENFTSNIVESFQSSVCKMIQGKRTNLVTRGSYTRRVNAAMFSFQYGPGWYHPAYKLIHKNSPAKLWRSRFTKGSEEKRLRLVKGRIRKPKRGLVRDTPTSEYFSKTRRPQGNMYYGLHASRPDIPALELQGMIEDLEKSLQISSIEEQLKIVRETVGQFENSRYRERRKLMITASICGRIYSLRDQTSNRGLLDTLLGPNVSAKEMRWGHLHERDAVRGYQTLHNCIVQPSGLFVSLENGVLGASPDGIVGDDGIIEVKCPFSARLCEEELDVLSQCTFLRMSSDGDLQLKPSSNYYRQVVMQLHVSQRQWCDFIVWTQGPMRPDDDTVPKCLDGFIIVIRIYRNEDTLKYWELMKPKLLQFYREDFAPELKDPRFDRNMGYKQPEYRLKAMLAQKNKRPKKAAVEESAEIPVLPTAKDRLQAYVATNVSSLSRGSIPRVTALRLPGSSAGTNIGFTPTPMNNGSDSD
jgi:hypothetical protein